MSSYPARFDPRFLSALLPMEERVDGAKPYKSADVCSAHFLYRVNGISYGYALPDIRQGVAGDSFGKEDQCRPGGFLDDPDVFAVFRLLLSAMEGKGI